MKTTNRVLIWALLLALTAGLAMAQSEGEQATEGDGTEAVYTMEDLKKLDENKPSSVYTNESLDDAEPEESAGYLIIEVIEGSDRSFPLHP